MACNLLTVPVRSPVPCREPCVPVRDGGVLPLPAESVLPGLIGVPGAEPWWDDGRIACPVRLILAI